MKINTLWPAMALLSLFILSALAPTAAYADWRDDVTPSTIFSSTCPSVEVIQNVPDGSGGFISLYLLYPGGSQFEYYLQRVDENGNTLWGNDGFSALSLDDISGGIPSIVEDGNGGVYLLWSEDLDNVHATKLQRYDATGQALWSAGGVFVCWMDDDQINPSMVPHSNGGVVVGWTGTTWLGVTGLAAQKMSPEGFPQWENAGTRVLANPIGSPQLFMAQGDIPGETIFAWKHGTNLVAQKLDTDGTKIWAEDDVLNYSQMVQDHADPQWVQVMSDDMGGVFGLFNSGVNFFIAHQSIDNNPINAMGQVMQAQLGIPYEAKMIHDGQNGVLIACWNEDFNGMDAECRVSVTHVTYSLNCPWTNAGITIDNDTENGSGPVPSNMDLMPDGAGGFYIGWQINPSIPRIQHYNHQGTALWSDERPALSAGDSFYAIDLLPGKQNGVVIQFLCPIWGTDYLVAKYINPLGINAMDSFELTATEDRPNDQGGEVTLSWQASKCDMVNNSEIANYSLWVRPAAGKSNDTTILNLPEELQLGNDELAGLLQMDQDQVVKTQTSGWTYAGMVPAVMMADYSAFCPTYGDSAASGITQTDFLVLAHYRTPGVIWEADNILTGYSIDNLAPGAPLALTGINTNGSADLTWNASGHYDEDLAGYLVYCGDEAGFVIDESSMLGTTISTEFLDNTATGTSYYRVTAIDAHGNESPASSEVMVQMETSSVDGLVPTVFNHRGNYPNPFNPMTNIAFDLPADSQVRITVYDAAGHLVITLINKSLNAGAHKINWNGQDQNGRAVSSGVYFSCIYAGDHMATRSMMLVR